MTCFEADPFADPTPQQRERVGEAARRLVELRDGWPNPPGLDPPDLAKRTLTNFYDQRPTWLAMPTPISTPPSSPPTPTVDIVGERETSRGQVDKYLTRIAREEAQDRHPAADGHRGAQDHRPTR